MQALLACFFFFQFSLNYEVGKMEFNEQIKRLRKENNLTQEEMAKKLNITRQAISNWENNRNLPDFEMII